MYLAADFAWAWISQLVLGMTTSVIIGLVLGIVVFAVAAWVVRRSYADRSRGRVIHNTQRPARPEPGESEPINRRET